MRAGSATDTAARLYRCVPDLQAGAETVCVVSAVTAVTQQHVVGVALPPADAAASVEKGAGPEDAPLQTGQVDKHLSEEETVNMLQVRGVADISQSEHCSPDLRQAAAGQQRLPPPLQHRPADTPTVTAV